MIHWIYAKWDALFLNIKSLWFSVTVLWTPVGMLGKFNILKGCCGEKMNVMAAAGRNWNKLAWTYGRKNLFKECTSEHTGVVFKRIFLMMHESRCLWQYLQYDMFVCVWGMLGSWVISWKWECLLALGCIPFSLERLSQRFSVSKVSLYAASADVGTLYDTVTLMEKSDTQGTQTFFLFSNRVGTQLYAWIMALNDSVVTYADYLLEQIRFTSCTVSV